MKLPAIILLSCWLAAGALAESLTGSSGKAVINAFLAMYAKDEVGWKKDVYLNAVPGQIAPGRQLGQSATVGYYSFVPKTWDDLTDDEKADVIKDSRLKAFLISSRLGSLAESTPSGDCAFPIEAAKPSPPTPSPVPFQPLLIKISPQAVVNGQGVKVDLSK